MPGKPRVVRQSGAFTGFEKEISPGIHPEAVVHQERFRVPQTGRKVATA
jgi:hypothetical protein